MFAHYWKFLLFALHNSIIAIFPKRRRTYTIITLVIAIDAQCRTISMHLVYHQLCRFYQLSNQALIWPIGLPGIHYTQLRNTKSNSSVFRTSCTSRGFVFLNISVHLLLKQNGRIVKCTIFVFVSCLYMSITLPFFFKLLRHKVRRMAMI